jgi:hypothetical protein
MVLSQRIEATRVHFTHKDFDLAYSNMLDAVLESEDLKLFRRVIALEEAKEQQTSFNEQAWLDQCLEICDELE